MANITADRVLETSTTVGAGAYTLNGAVTGFRSLASVAAVADTFYYFAEDINSSGALIGGWEVGSGTVNANGTVERLVSASSNNNIPVVWAAGTRRIGLGLNAAQLAGISAATAAAASDALVYAILFGAD